MTHPFGPATEKYRELGTVADLLVFNRFETLPTRNFRSGRFEGAERLAADDLDPGRRSRLDAMIAAYYAARGWTETGQVPWSLRRELGLDSAAFGPE